MSTGPRFLRGVLNDGTGFQYYLGNSISPQRESGKFPLVNHFSLVHPHYRGEYFRDGLLVSAYMTSLSNSLSFLFFSLLATLRKQLSKGEPFRCIFFLILPHTNVIPLSRPTFKLRQIGMSFFPPQFFYSSTTTRF